MESCDWTGYHLYSVSGSVSIKIRTAVRIVLPGHRAPGARPAVSEQQEAAHGEEAGGEAAVQPAEAQPRVAVTRVTGILTLLPRS